MPLDHLTTMDRPDTDLPGTLGGNSRRTARSIRSRDGPIRGSRIAALRQKTLPRKGGKVPASCEASEDHECSWHRSHIEPWHWSDTRTSDLLDPPTTPSQHMRQRVLAIVLALVIATLLGHVGL